jgi:hypothetical protein
MIRRIERNIRAMLGYLDRLTGRMRQKIFPANDPLKFGGEAARARRCRRCTR